MRKLSISVNNQPIDAVHTLLSANPENNYSKNYARLVPLVTSNSMQHSEQMCIGIHSESDEKSTQTLKVMIQQYSCQRVVKANSDREEKMILMARSTQNPPLLPWFLPQSN